MTRKNPQLDTILNSIADGVFTINLDREITSFNRAAERITGITREQAIGQKCFDVFHANICQGRCAMEKTLKTGKSIIDLPVSILNIRGKTVPISVSTAVLGDIVDGRVKVTTTYYVHEFLQVGPSLDRAREETLRQLAAAGIGLAAPQVEVNRRAEG